MSPLGHEIFMDVWDILKGEERDFCVCVCWREYITNSRFGYQMQIGKKGMIGCK